MSELPRPKTPTKTANQLFYNLCVAYSLDFQAMQEIADSAQVHISVVGQMFVNTAVRHVEAEKVLAAFSQRIGTPWTLDTMKVALQPTFAELHSKHSFDLRRLAIGAGAEEQVIEMMLSGQPVTPQEARLVLQKASRLAGEHYTLETVDVPVINEEVQQQ